LQKGAGSIELYIDAWALVNAQPISHRFKYGRHGAG